MEGSDFKMPSPKRQRTASPVEERRENSLPSSDNTVQGEYIARIPDNEETSVRSTERPVNESDMLDTLMQHVEAEASPEMSTSMIAHASVDNIAPIAAPQVSVAQEQAATSNPVPSTEATEHQNVAATASSASRTNPPTVVATDETTKHQDAVMDDIPTEGSIQEEKTDKTNAVDQPIQEAAQVDGNDVAAHRDADSSMIQAAAAVDGIPPVFDSAHSADGAEGAEWEVDSSPYESSSDSSSDDSSSDDSDDDADGDYAMLDPEEQARILMQGDAGSDDEGDKSKSKGDGTGLKTANEQAEDIPQIPDIIVTEEMKIEELGVVQSVVENTVLIMAKVSGEYQVLESGSLLCLADRKVAGVVAEPLGRVEQPLYTVRFRTEQDIKDRGLSEKGTTVYYVPTHSFFVFTQPLKAVKGSDASNFHDEEVGDEEVEFSDDEAEAEHKRQMKAKRQGRLGDVGRGRGAGRGGRGGQRGNRNGGPTHTDTNGSAYGNGSLEMNYDDVEDGEEGYTPLARPTNLHEMTSSAQNGSTPAMAPPLPPFTQSDRSRGRGNNRGGRDRDRGRGGRGARGNSARGAPFNQNRNNMDRNPFQSNNNSVQNNAYDQQQSQYPYPPPPPPMLTPQASAYPNSLVTSPMSPLPNQQFNFAAAFQNSQPYNTTFQQHTQSFNQPQPQSYNQQQNQAFNQQNAYFNPVAMQHFNQQQQNPYPNPWQINQAAAAEVQRRLEEMQRQANMNRQQ